MHPFYANRPQPPQRTYYQPPSVSPARYPTAPPHTFGIIPQVSRHPSSNSFDEMIKKKYTENDNKLHNAISRSPLDMEARRQCQGFIAYLRIHKNLFLHTFVHLVTCCNCRYLHQLVDHANHWKEWDSVKQLARHSLIKSTLISFWDSDYGCHQHQSLLSQQLSIKDDDDDLLYHLLYCCRKPELYELSNNPVVRGVGRHVFKESEQVVDLLWKFIMEKNKKDIERRLLAHIYRMARKSAYLPHDLQIVPTSVSHQRPLGPSGNGLAIMAMMDGRNVFIKKIMCNDRASLTKCIEMYSSEAILWKTLQHKNIVPFLGVIEEGTVSMGLVSPFYRNGNIKAYMGKHPQDWPTLAKRFAKDIAKGLEYIHSHEPPIIHGDLKGDNILVDDEGHARISDFGQSYASDTGKYLDSTRVGLAISPFHWMAPELLLGGETAKTTVKSDMYSFGCVLYEMLSGTIPFQGLSPGDVLQHIRTNQRPKRPVSIADRDPLWRVIEKCWTNDPEDRPSAARLIKYL